MKQWLDLKDQTLCSYVDRTIKAEDEWSVLHVACYNGHTEIVKLLNDVDMNVNEATNKGCTPLNIACQKGHYDTVNYLLDLNGHIFNSRVDITKKDQDGNTVLHAASSAGHS